MELKFTKNKECPFSLF